MKPAASTSAIIAAFTETNCAGRVGMQFSCMHPGIPPSTIYLE
jgi:hypothetical protein